MLLYYWIAYDDIVIGGSYHLECDWVATSCDVEVKFDTRYACNIAINGTETICKWFGEVELLTKPFKSLLRDDTLGRTSRVQEYGDWLAVEQTLDFTDEHFATGGRLTFAWLALSRRLRCRRATPNCNGA